MQILRSLLLTGLVCSTAPLVAQDSVPKVPAKAAEKPKSDPKPKVDLKRLKWMAGCWAAETGKDQSAEEIWTNPVENLLIGVTRYFRKDRATTYDFNRIEATDSSVVFSIRNEGKPESIYTLKTIVDEYVVFENEKKEFPQRIIYRLASDGSLIPRNEGDAPSFEVRMTRVKCPGGDIKLRP
jgi:hypothetical protein